MQFTTPTTILALFAATGFAAPTANTNVLLCKETNCTGPGTAQFNLPVITGVCTTLPTSFQNSTRAVKPNGGTNCTLFEGLNCTPPSSQVAVGGRTTNLPVNHYIDIRCVSA